MGYIHHPIPLDVWAKMTPEQRRMTYLSERAFLMRVSSRQCGSFLISAVGVALVLLVILLEWVA